MLNVKSPKFVGPLRCAKYAFMPNKLTYCGGTKQDFLFESVVSNLRHQELPSALAEFETMFPYLKTIAQANFLSDPFSEEVVEAYWLGNELLQNVSQKNFYNHLTENLKLKKKLPVSQFFKIERMVKNGFSPHHNFHVLNVWLAGKAVGNSAFDKIFDNCRIGFGQVLMIKENSLLAESDEIYFKGDKLAIRPKQKEIVYKIFNESFAPEVKIGDWVSVHWNFVCEIITSKQLANLRKFTNSAVDFYNNLPVLRG